MNAKQELIDFLKKSSAAIGCAEITFENDSWDLKDRKYFYLPVRHTEEQLTIFLDSLDFDYDCGFGSQELFGTVWLQDNTWLSRREYDGSEWWEHNQLPIIPKYLK